MTIKPLDANDEDLVTLRRYLHSTPELSWDEKNTAAHIIELYERDYKPDQIIRLATHGIAFIFEGVEPGPSVLIRSELDALPIQETNTFAHKSKFDGISHKCGHDGHMAMVAGVAKHIAQNRPQKGRIILLYQPAEETGDGARTVYEDPNFEKIKPDYAFSLHNVPLEPLGQIRCCVGSFTPSVKSMIVKLTGKTTHAAKPENGINPGLAIAEITQAVEEINKNAPIGAFATLIHVRVGEKAYGVSAGDAEIHYTLRGISNDDLNTIWNQVIGKIENIAQKHKLLETSFDYTEEFMANTNDEDAVNMVRHAASELGFDYHEMDRPNPWGEDFGIMTSNLKGAMFGLGSGVENPDLHNPDYDFPDEIIHIGSSMFIHLIEQVMKKDLSENEAT